MLARVDSYDFTFISQAILIVLLIINSYIIMSNTGVISIYSVRNLSVACGMVQQLKMLATKTDNLGRRWEPTPASCSLNTKHAEWHMGMHVYMHTHKWKSRVFCSAFKWLYITYHSADWLLSYVSGICLLNTVSFFHIMYSEGEGGGGGERWVVVCAHNPSIGKVETSRPQGSLASQPRLLGLPCQGSERSLHSNKVPAAEE